MKSYRLQFRFPFRISIYTGGILLFLAVILVVVRMNIPESFEATKKILAQSPCINSVCVGTSNRANVFQELLNEALLDDIVDNGGTSIHFRVKKDAVVGSINFVLDEARKDEIVETITILTRGMRLDIALGTLGEPDQVLLFFACGQGDFIYGKLFYLHQGIEVDIQYPSSRKESNDLVSLDLSTPVIWIWYFDPQTYDERLINIDQSINASNGFFNISPINSDILVKYIQPWGGLNQPIPVLDVCN